MTGVSDEAVEAAAESLHRFDWGAGWEIEPNDVVRERYREQARSAITAALPHLQPQPVASRSAIADVLREFGHEENGGGWVLFADNLDDFANALLAAGVFRSEAEVKVDVIAVINAEVDHDRCAKRASRGVEQLLSSKPE